MPSRNGRLTNDEVIATGLPYYLPASKQWNDEPYDFAILLSEKRCLIFGVPILDNGTERPAAFYYAGGTDKDNPYQFWPLYDRTEKYKSGELRMIPFDHYESMGHEI